MYEYIITRPDGLIIICSSTNLPRCVMTFKSQAHAFSLHYKKRHGTQYAISFGSIVGYLFLLHVKTRYSNKHIPCVEILQPFLAFQTLVVPLQYWSVDTKGHCCTGIYNNKIFACIGKKMLSTEAMDAYGNIIMSAPMILWAIKLNDIWRIISLIASLKIHSTDYPVQLFRW